jgi:flagellar protein FlaJ
VVAVPKIEEWQKKVAWIVSSVLGVAILIVAGIFFINSPLFDECVVLAVMVTIFLPTMLNLIDSQWKNAVNAHLPDLFRAIVQAQQTGMTLPQAIEESSKRDYGPLTRELKKLVSQMSWGVSFEEALEAFAEHIDTPLVKRVVPIVNEASRSGGRVEKVFEPMEKFIQATLTLEKERKARTRPYVAIIYVAFLVFLFTIVLLFRSFFTPITQDSSLLGNVLLTPEAARRLFFRMSALQAFFGGLVAGKMGEGTINNGLKHSLILLACGAIIFKIMI